MTTTLDRRSVLMGAAALAAAPSGALAQTASPARLTVAVQGSPRSLEPLREFSNVAWRIGYNVFEGLLAIDFQDNMRIRGGLAESWRRVSPTVTELTLREGVRFHNGDLVTAEDVAFSFGPERMTGDRAPGRPISRIFVGTIARVEAVDARTVRVVTSATDPLIEQRLAGWTAQIVSKRAFLAATNFEAWERAPVGTGPYKVREFRIDERVVLEAHDAYWGGRPPAREIRFTVMPELASRVAALAAGEVDMITELSLDQVPAIERLAGRDVVGGPILNIRTLVYDKSNPVLADARVRRAISVAIDRQAIVETLYRGRTRPTATIQHPAFGALNDPERRGAAFDPDLARRLLREAGYSGQPIPYRSHQSYYGLQAQTAQVLIEMWRAVGLNVDLQFKENWTQIFDTASPRGIRDWSNSVLFNDPVGVLSRLYGPRGPVQTIYREWSNDEFNRFAGVIETSETAAERRTAFQRMLDIYDETDPPGTALHDLVMLYGKKSNIRWTAYSMEYMDFGPRNLSFA
jgi:peptide/nickel transport system substrate-binding protein